MFHKLAKTARTFAKSHFNLNNPTATKAFLNLYSPYVGAGVKVLEVNYDEGFIKVSMPLTWRNKNIVGTQFGGSLYSMTDPFFMTLLMQKLGSEYVVWDKSAYIDFIKAGTSDVFATFKIDNQEIETVKELAKDGKAVFREYEVDIVDVNGEVIAKVKKTLYIRLRAFSKSAGFVSRF
ncbi:MAG: DUF4442 domain-containing protein [Moraxella sp.]|uniref:DUF4442 domain-containing protein n=1 Tax=Moraxella sp. TaxID=479 RepID=UPI0026DCB614|nr:DUF4442 domain-containing protein [Moraxella sp.]MDO4451054.1 DUF4442 domain-containing protein [Moraxella sp.]